MPVNASILIYGRKPDLLRTRGWVLEKTGYRVLSAHSFPEAERLAKTFSIGLIVLCHTLSAEELDRALSADPFQLPTRRLLMTTNILVSSHNDEDELLSAFDGPGALVRKAKDMMSVTVGENFSS